MQNGKSTLTIVQGFIGAGKTTFSKKLEKDTGAIRLNGDEYCEKHFSEHELQSNWDACFAKAIEHLWIKAEEALRSGKSVILDFGFWSRESRDHAKNIAKRLGVNFQHIYLDVPDNILIERLKTRSGHIAENNIKNFETLKQSFDEPGTDEDYIVVK